MQQRELAPAEAGGDAGERRDRAGDVEARDRPRRMERPAGMAEAGAGHHRQRGQADGADGPGVQRRGRGEFGAGDARRQHEAAEADEDAGDVEHHQQRLAGRAPAGPAGEAGEIDEAGDRQGHGGHPVFGQHDPDRHGDTDDDARHLIEAGEGRRHAAGAARAQPVGGEARDDAAADHHHQHQDRGDGDADRPGRGTAQRHLDVEDRVRHREERDEADDLEIAPVAAGDHLAAGDEGEADGEEQVEDRRRDRAERRRGEDRDAADRPQHDEDEQRPADHRQAPRPVGNGGEEEAGDRRAGIAPQHLVGMPVDRREPARQGDHALPQRQPDQHGDGGPQAGRQEERAKAAGEPGGAAMGAVAFRGAGHQ